MVFEGGKAIGMDLSAFLLLRPELPGEGAIARVGVVVFVLHRGGGIIRHFVVVVKDSPV